MSKASWLWLSKEFGGCGETCDADEIVLWCPHKLRNLRGRDITVERDTSKDLKLAQPFEACEKLVLR